MKTGNLFSKHQKLKKQLMCEMQPDCINIMNEEFYFFDGNHKRFKSFVTLTASTYDPLLQKQVALAILECKHEDTESIEVFWRLFNSAFKEVQGIGDRFSPAGFCTDMSTANFNGPLKIYGEKILEKVKRCEFHFRDSINRKVSTLGEQSSKCKEISLSMLTSTTPEVPLKSCKILLTNTKNLQTFNTGLIGGIIVEN